MESLQNVQGKTKVKLTVDNVAACLMRQYTPKQIAQAFNVTVFAVYKHIKRNIDVLQPILDASDTLLIAKSRRITSQGFDHINNILESNEFDKKDLPSLSITTGTMFDKMRILQNKSTQNVSMDVVTGNIEERKRRRAELLQELEDSNG